jgi:serine protease Do
VWKDYGVSAQMTTPISGGDRKTEPGCGVAVRAMVRRTGLRVAVVLGLAAAAAAAEPVSSLARLRDLERKVESVYDAVLPATVALLAEATAASGSGVVVTADGLIATAAHVVMGAETMRVLFADGREFAGEVLGADFSRDIALVRINAGGPLPFAALGGSRRLEVGDWTVALGHSAGFDPARKPPLRFGRVIAKGPGEILTTDCTLIGGDSGGPLFDLDGRLVGIHSSIGGALNNNNHAGVDGLRADWERLVAGETWGRLSLNPLANPDTPVLGFVMGLGRGGVRVEEVVAGSPAARAGLQVGDLVVELADKKIDHGKALLIELAHRKPGERVRLGIRRQRSMLHLDIVLARRGDLYREEQ